MLLFRLTYTPLLGLKNIFFLPRVQPPTKVHARSWVPPLGILFLSFCVRESYIMKDHKNIWLCFLTGSLLLFKEKSMLLFLKRFIWEICSDPFQVFLAALIEFGKFFSTFFFCFWFNFWNVGVEFSFLVVAVIPCRTCRGIFSLEKV